MFTDRSVLCVRWYFRMTFLFLVLVHMCVCSMWLRDVYEGTKVGVIFYFYSELRIIEAPCRFMSEFRSAHIFWRPSTMLSAYRIFALIHKAIVGTIISPKPRYSTYSYQTPECSCFGVSRFSSSPRGGLSSEYPPLSGFGSGFWKWTLGDVVLAVKSTWGATTDATRSETRRMRTSPLAWTLW